MDLALFDLDGTLTKKDTFAEFIIYNHGLVKFYFGLFLLAPFFIFYKCGIIANWRAKEYVLAFFFKGWQRDTFTKSGDEFSQTRLPLLLRDIAKQQLDWHLSRGDKVVIVSASIDTWIKAWADANRCELIATELAYNGEKITGGIAGKNCYGPEKAKRIQERYDLSQFACIHAYGDSRGDKEMLELAHRKYYRWELLHD